MRLRYLLAGLLLAAAGAGCSSAPMVAEDMPPAVQDLKPACEQTKETGEECSTRNKGCDCIAETPTGGKCMAELDVSSVLQGLVIELPGNYCSTKTCELGRSCGERGTCIDFLGATGPTCLRRCSKGTCRDGYKCFSFDVDPNNPMSMAEANICVPPGEFSNCDPTADPKTQCTTTLGADTSTVTNGNPNGGCVRRGPDNVGLCQFFPCQVGPGNCPPIGNTQTSCMYIDLGRQYPGGQAGDTGKGLFCLPRSAMPKKLGETCQFLNDCEDNLICLRGTCRQMCFNGTQPTFMGGDMRYKNQARACPAGTACQDVFMVGGMNWPGACVPPM